MPADQICCLLQRAAFWEPFLPESDPFLCLVIDARFDLEEACRPEQAFSGHRLQ